MAGHHAFFDRWRKLEGQQQVDVDRRDLSDMLPHYWREEAQTPAEWFIRYGRAFGFHIRENVETGNFTMRRTRDEADEASITWPGKIGS